MQNKELNYNKIIPDDDENVMEVKDTSLHNSVPQTYYRAVQGPSEQKRTFNIRDCIFAVIFLVFSFVILRLLFPSGAGAGMVLLSGQYHIVIALMGVAALLYIAKPATVTQWIVYGCSVLFCLVPFFSSSAPVRFMSWVYAAILLCYFAYSFSDGSKLLSDGFLISLGAAVFAAPIMNFTGAPRAIFVPLKKSGKLGKNLLFILVGLLVSLPLTFVIVVILALADENFNKLADTIFSGIFDNFGQNLLIFIFSIPLSFLLFGILLHSVRRKRTINCDTSCISIIPSAVICAAVTPVIVSYMLFFFCQLPYFLGAFGGVLPEGYSYSEYARQGFFELCTVSVINLFVIAFIFLFAKNKENSRQKPIVTRIYTIILCFMTVILIASALSKMLLYIGEYGLTEKRLYTSWFMLLLGIVFITIILSQLIKRIPVVKTLFASFTIMLALLCFSDPDSLIAGYNVDLYLSGKSDSAEIGSMTHLSESAAPFIAELYGTDQEDNAEYWFEKFEERREDNTMYFSFSVPAMNVEHCLKKMAD